MGWGQLFLKPVSCCFVIWMSACWSVRVWSRGKDKPSFILSLLSAKHIWKSFPKGYLSPAPRRWTGGCSRGLEVRIPAAFQCRVYTFLCVVILPDEMRNKRVFDGCGTAALAELILLPWWGWEKLHFGRVALCVPINIRWEW